MKTLKHMASFITAKTAEEAIYAPIRIAHEAAKAETQRVAVLMSQELYEALKDLGDITEKWCPSSEKTRQKYLAEYEGFKTAGRARGEMRCRFFKPGWVASFVVEAYAAIEKKEAKLAEAKAEADRIETLCKGIKFNDAFCGRVMMGERQFGAIVATLVPALVNGATQYVAELRLNGVLQGVVEQSGKFVAGKYLSPEGAQALSNIR